MSENIQSADEVADSPKKGEPLSASTSSFEPLDPHDPNISRLATTLFEKTTNYLQLELNSTRDDYKLLEKMNTLTTAKYTDLQQIATNVSNQIEGLGEKYKQIQPILNKILEINENVTKLEDVAYRLDAYSKRLEEKYKSLEKRYDATLPS